MNRIKLFVLILTFTAVSLFEGCKNKDIDFESFKIEKETTTQTATSVSITGSYSFAGTVKGMKVNIGEKESLSDANLYEMQMEGTNFSVTVGDLKPSTEYYYRYSIDFGSSEDYLTEAKTFTTMNAVPVVPSVKALELLSIGDTIFRVKCEVVSDGGKEVTERGICWNNYGDPTIDDETIAYSSGGLGQYTIRMENLSWGKKYYVRAYAKNAIGTGLSDEILELQTPLPPGIQIILEANPEEGGTVSGEGIFETGEQCTINAIANTGYDFVNWTENDTVVSSNSEYTFTVTTNRILTANFTKKTISITTTVSPQNSGTVTGAGNYLYGDICELIATPNSSSEFKEWKKDGLTVSTNAHYSFTVTEPANYVACFTVISYNVTISVNPVNGGEVTGASTYSLGQSCTIQATPAAGFIFDYWSENDIVVSVHKTYSFTVTSDHNFVAHFQETSHPIGAIPGLFTINNQGEQVYFSKGNLQYIGSASLPYWKFAEHQWDYLGTTTNQNSVERNVDRDLFGWGTSGYHDTNDPMNSNYSPWSTSTLTDYYGPSNSMPSQNLTEGSANYDWGVFNPINNGGNIANIWRTLTGGENGEWNYIFNVRSASMVNGTFNARYVKARVANVSGVILFPDSYTHPISVLPPTGINSPATGYYTNIYSESDFELMENAGAVFLPTAGYRNRTDLYNGGVAGYYWSTTHESSRYAFNLDFSSDNIDALNAKRFRYLGLSVRLVYPYQGPRK